MTSSISSICSALGSCFPARRSIASEPGSPQASIRTFGRSSSVSSSLAGVEQSNVQLLRYQSISDDAASTASLPATVAELHEACPPRASWLHDHFMVGRASYREKPSGHGSKAENTSVSPPSLAPDASRPNSGKRSVIVDALRHIFMPRRRTPIDKLRSATSELADMQLRHSLTERGRRAEMLYGETMVKWHKEGDLAAYSYVKQRIADVRKASLAPLRYDQVHGRAMSRPNSSSGSVESSRRRNSTCDGTEAIECRSSLPSIEDDSVFDFGADLVAPTVVIATQENASHMSTSSAGSSIGNALQRMFSMPERTPGEKLQKLVKELRSAQILYSSSQRGDRATKLLREVDARRHSNGDFVACLHAKENIRSVREASTAISPWLEKITHVSI